MDLDKNHSDVDNVNCETANRKLGSSANEYDTCTTTTISSPEPEEYTYEGAIEGYKSRIISQTNSQMVKTVVNDNHKEKSPDNMNKIRKSVSNKLEEKISSFQTDRAIDIKDNNKKADLPKGNIHKRREQFERENSQESQLNKTKLPDIANKTSIKERLSSLEKFNEYSNVQKITADVTKLAVEVKPLKERLSSLEKNKIETDKGKRLSNGDLSTNAKSVKERLSSLTSQTSEEEVKTRSDLKEVSMTLKERLSSLDAAKNKEILKIVDEVTITNLKIETKEPVDHSMKSDLSGLENQMQSFCRSLDSLDINGQSSPSSFERVQSLEDFDCSDIQNNIVQSDIETEDSGIHTARDSCAPADDIADLTQVSSPVGEPMVEVSEYESSNEDVEPKIRDAIMKPVEHLESVSQEPGIEEVDEQELSKAEDTDSASNYTQATSHPIEDLSVTDEITEIHLDKDDEDTLKSLDNQDTSVSLNEPISSGSEGDTVVFEGKMTIHLNLNEICNTVNSGAGSNSNLNNSTSTNDPAAVKSMPMVTVSNITTTTNISPKNSLKMLKSCEHSSLLSKVTGYSSSSNRSNDTNYNLSSNIDLANDRKSPTYNRMPNIHNHDASNRNSDIISTLKDNKVSKNDLPFSSNRSNGPNHNVNRKIESTNDCKLVTCNKMPNIHNVKSSNRDSDVIITHSENKVNKYDANDTGSSQDSNPFWQKRTRRSIEPNRRKTILLINNKVTTKTTSTTTKSSNAN